MIDGQQELDLALLRFGEQLLGEFDFVFFQQRFADLFTLGLEEGVSHAAADEEGIDLLHQVADDFDFVADLGAAEDGNERAGGIGHGLAHVLEFFFHEQAGSGFLDELGDADG